MNINKDLGNPVVMDTIEKLTKNHKGRLTAQYFNSVVNMSL